MFISRDIKIINKKFKLDIYGFPGTIVYKDHIETVFPLMNKMWSVIKKKGLKHKGLNTCVYESGERIFAGVELYDLPRNHRELEQKTIVLKKYAYYKYIGDYDLIRQVIQIMRDEIMIKGLEVTYPYIEIYRYWADKKTESETELFICLK